MGYCLKVQIIDVNGDTRTVKMVDLENFIVNFRIPPSNIDIIFASEIQRIIVNLARSGHRATKIEIQEKYAILKLSSANGDIEYQFWILKTEDSSI